MAKAAAPKKVASKKAEPKTEMTVAQLREVCDRKNIEYTSKDNAEALKNKLDNHDKPAKQGPKKAGEY